MMAVRQRSLPVVRAILEKDANGVIKAEQPQPGQGSFVTRANSPLVSAIESGRPDIAEVLIQHGAPVNKKYEQGYTPLMIAASIDSPAVELLLKNGADPFLKNAQGKTSLDLARQFNHQQASRVLEKWIKQSKGR
jgi:ankyrin repeat protein